MLIERDLSHIEPEAVDDDVLAGDRRSGAADASAQAVKEWSACFAT